MEDDESCKNLTECTVKEMGYDVTTASGGIEGLQLFKQSIFEIIISDIKMPDMDGITLVSNIKEMDPDAVIILITAYPDISTVVQTIKRGVYDFISKPFDPENLKITIRNAWEKKYRDYQKKLLLYKLQQVNKQLIYVEKKLEDQTGKLKGLSVFASRMVAKLEFVDEVVNAIPDAIIGLFPHCIVRLWIRDSDKDINRIRLIIQKGAKTKGTKNSLVSGEGGTGSVYRSGMALYKVHSSELQFEDSQWLVDNNIVNYSIFPLKVGMEVIGALNVFFTKDMMLEDYEKEILASFCDISAITIKNSMLYEEVKKDTITDHLTGLNNRRYANMRLDEEFRRAERGDYDNFAVVMGDVNNFKIINDTLGHQTGDVVLQLIGHILKDTIRTTDIASRYGGDEFLIILPGTDCFGAEKLVKKIVAKIAEINQEGYHPEFIDAPVEISMSFGISCRGCTGLEITSLVSKADYALHECKVSENGEYAMYERLKQLCESNMPSETDKFEREVTNRIAYSLASLIDHKDKKIRNHSKLVSRLSVKVGKNLLLEGEIISRLQLGGMLHDIGKLGIPLEILNKKDKLTENEAAIMRNHVNIGVKMVSHIHNLAYLVPIVAAVHERWDGKGYPNGLKGEEIPIESRIIAVVDTYLAMRMDRTYRKGMMANTAIETIVNGSGTQFDPRVVESFSQVHKEDMEKV